MNEPRKRIWNEAVKGAIETFLSKHEEYGSPLTIDCLDINKATPFGESGHLKIHTRLFRLNVNADEKGDATWDEAAYPESFEGGVVKFVITVPFRIDDLCEELDVDLSFQSADSGRLEQSEPRVRL